MSVIADFILESNGDGYLTVRLQAPVPVGDWAVFYEQSLRKGGIPFIVKSSAPGYGGGQSGVFVTNSGVGQWNVALFASDFNNSGAQALFPDAVSGYTQQNNYWRFGRDQSGYKTTLSEGFRIQGG